MIPALHSGQYVSHTYVDYGGTVYYIKVGDEMVGAYRIATRTGECVIYTYDSGWTRHGVITFGRDLFS